MRNKFLFIFYILFIFNTNLFSNENDKTLKVGLLVPLSGPYNEIGNSLLYSLQLALEEINDKNVIIVPRDSGFSDADKLNSAVDDMRNNGVKIIIGPTTYEDFEIHGINHGIFENLITYFIKRVNNKSVNNSSLKDAYASTLACEMVSRSIKTEKIINIENL